MELSTHLIVIVFVPFAVRIFPAVAGITDHVYVPLLMSGPGTEYVIVLFTQAIGALGVMVGNGKFGQVFTTNTGEDVETQKGLAVNC